MQINILSKYCHDYLVSQSKGDVAHDVLHVKRVVGTAQKFAQIENANLYIVIPAAWLHDCVWVSKSSDLRKKASQLAADKAIEYLSSINYSKEYFDGVYHAILTHSFSAGYKPKTIEAKVLQDADRLDALGAVGIARCFSVGGVLQRDLYSVNDPFCKMREPDDVSYTLDHFYTKLLKLTESMTTQAGYNEAKKRTETMVNFLESLEREIVL